MKIKFIFSLTLSTFITSFTAYGAPAWKVETGSQASSWVNELKTNQSHYEILKDFFPNSSPAELEATSQKILDLHKAEIQSVVNAPESSLSGTCSDKITAQFGPFSPGAQSGNPSQKAFESEMLGIKASFCLNTSDLNKALSIFLSDEFNLQSTANLTSSRAQPDNNSICQTTSVLMIGKSDYCVRVRIFKTESLVIVFSFNEYNNPQASAPVYTRLTTSIFQKRKDGKIQFNNRTFGRGPSLPFHSIVVSQVKSGQIEFKDTFQEWLK